MGIVECLLGFYQPTVVALEDWTVADSRRSLRNRRILYHANMATMKAGIPVYMYPPSRLKEVFQSFGARTKEERALYLSYLFPELAIVLPKKRRA